jgi:hypothetical protein
MVLVKRWILPIYRQSTVRGDWKVPATRFRCVTYIVVRIHKSRLSDYIRRLDLLAIAHSFVRLDTQKYETTPDLSFR